MLSPGLTSLLVLLLNPVSCQTLNTTDVSLPPVCPALGATILGQTQAAVDSGQPFTLAVAIRDDFHSLVTSGPGSDWAGSACSSSSSSSRRRRSLGAL